MQRGSAESVAPKPRLVAELKRVARSAQNLIDELAKTNLDPVKFPQQRLIGIAETMVGLPAGSEDGALPALEYAEAALNDLRFSSVEIAEDDQLPDVPRGDRLDQALSALISDIGTAKRFYSQAKLAAAAKSQTPEHAVAAPGTQQRETAERMRSLSNQGREVAGELDQVTAELAARKDPDQVKVDNLARKGLDVANLERQEAIEIGTEKPHIAWLEKLHRGVVVGLRAVELCAGVAKIAVEKVSKVYTTHVTDWLVAARDGAEETRTLIAKLKEKWQKENDGHDPNRRPYSSPRDFSIFHDPFADGSGRGPDLVVIPAGDFRMGSAENEARLKDDDRAFANEIVKGRGTHPMRIARRFALSRYPVTFDDYDAFLAAPAGQRARQTKRVDDNKWGRGRRPVIDVSWNDAQAYCDWLNKRTGLRGDVGYRLPSEAEWEYACRAGTQMRRWWGDEWDPAKANGARSFEGGKTSPVDQYAPNPWGLHDMIGNVWEWCADEYAENISMLPPDGAPYGKSVRSARSLRVLRGGSWVDDPLFLRSAVHSGGRPVSRDIDGGFRVARTL